MPPRAGFLASRECGEAQRVPRQQRSNYLILDMCLLLITNMRWSEQPANFLIRRLPRCANPA
jgi:hypothetical protein